jgi:hypothetical protein
MFQKYQSFLSPAWVIFAFTHISVGEKKKVTRKQKIFFRKRNVRIYKRATAINEDMICRLSDVYHFLRSDVFKKANSQ